MLCWHCCLQGVAINFVKSDDIRILRDIEQYYSTQVDEMVSMVAFMARWTVCCCSLWHQWKKKKNDIHFCLCSQWMWQTWYRSCTACMRRFGGLKHQSLLAAVRETCTVVRCPSADICVTGSHSHKVVISHINEADAVCFIVFPFMYCCKICTASEMVMPSIIDTMLPDYCGMHSLDFYEHVWMWLPQV